VDFASFHPGGYWLCLADNDRIDKAIEAIEHLSRGRP
jgi:hypothetical protein